MHRTSKFLAGTAIIILGLVQPSVAGEKRVLDFTNEGSTSHCIGDPKTPLCAAETLEACRIRSEWKLCEPIEHDYSIYGDRIPGGYTKLIYYRYEILHEQTLKKGDLVHQPKWRKQNIWRIGDAAVALWWESCLPIESCVRETQQHPARKFGEGCRSFRNCGHEDHPRTYILRREGSRWIVIANYGRPVFPELFWNRK